MFKNAKTFRQGTGLGREEEVAIDAQTARTAAPLQFLHPQGEDVTGAAAPPAIASADIVVDDSPLHALREYPSVPYYGLLPSFYITADVATAPRSDAAPRSEATHTGAAAMGGAALGSSSPCMNVHTAAARVPRVERRLNQALQQVGSAYVLSNCGCDHHHRRATDSEGMGRASGPGTTATEIASSVAHASVLPYSAYIAALTSIFRDFHRLRGTGHGPSSSASSPLPSVSAPAPPPHTLHLRISGHPRWRDLGVLLTVEQGRLVLFLSSSSRTTQAYIRQRTREHSQELPWVAGAALVVEPTQMRRTDLNPVLAVWNVLLNLPLGPIPGLIPPSPPPPRDLADEESVAEGKGSGRGRYRRHRSSSNSSLVHEGAGVQAVMQVTPQFLEGFQVSMVSSLPFPGASQHTPVARLESVTPILAAATAKTSTSTAAAATEGEGNEATGNPLHRRELLGRQFTWRVTIPTMFAALAPGVPPPPTIDNSGANSTRVSSAAAATVRRRPPPLLVPAALFTVVGCLIERCSLDTFSITIADTSVAMTSATMSAATATTADTNAATATTSVTAAAQGMTYIGLGFNTSGTSTSGGLMGGGASTSRGSSSQSWATFSRLSSMAWLSDDERRALGLMDVEEDGEETPLECEFALLGLRYRRDPAKATEAWEAQRAEAKRARGQDAEGYGEVMMPSWSLTGQDGRRREAVTRLSKRLNSGPVAGLHSPKTWGPSFRLLVSVTRAMVAPSDEVDVD